MGASTVGILKGVDLKAIYRGDVIPDKKKLMDGEGLYIHLKLLKTGSLNMHYTKIFR